MASLDHPRRFDDSPTSSRSSSAASFRQSPGLGRSPSPQYTSNSSSARIFFAVAARFAHPRLLIGLVSQIFNKRFFFSLAAITIVAAKITHIHAHLAALGLKSIFAWGLTFFAQDAALLLVLRLLLDGELYMNARWIRAFATTVASLIIMFLLIIGTVNITFYSVTAAEVHWRNVGFAGGKSSGKLLRSGLVAFTLVVSFLLFTSWLLQDVCYFLAGVGLQIIKWPFTFVLRKIPATRKLIESKVEYSHLPQQDGELASSYELKDADTTPTVPEERTDQAKLRVFAFALVAVSLVAQIALSIARPDAAAFTFMSWTLPLLPVIDFAEGAQNLGGLLPYYGGSIEKSWDDHSALGKAVNWDWLPKVTSLLPESNVLGGFEDWYEQKDHYRASKDPLKISNLEDSFLPGLKEKLADIKIRNVMLIKLESTRKDIFPIKKNGFIAQSLIGSTEEKRLPQQAWDRLKTLTPTANFLTGDYDDGFEHAEKKRRGGINCNNAFTSATYTRKSMTGTLCGITPLVQDFNVEWQHHIYQPCLPHIFNAFNHIDNGEKSEKSEKGNSTEPDFIDFKWKSKMMQSVTDSYDKGHEQQPYLGYTYDNLIHKEYLKSDNAKFGKVDLPDINYYGMAEIALEPYVRDAFVQAKKNNERLFLTHLTSTTHHPFAIPEEDPYVALTEDANLNDLSHYANAIGYVDRWIGKILTILDEENVANETLIIFVGDHGISVAENDAVTPYYNANVGNFRVPLVVSHPQLPVLDVNTPVNSIQILPTILDLLRSTNSLSKPVRKAASDLVHNYAGQSLIRPLRLYNNATNPEREDWQFTVMNPGRAMLSVRDARHANWRIVVPVVENVEWRFTELNEDPNELNPTVAFGFFAFLAIVEEKHGGEAAKWCEQAAFQARWFVKESEVRYRYS